MNKNVLSLMLAAAMVVSMTACGAEEPSAPPAANDPQPPVEQEIKGSTEAVTVDGMQLGMGLAMENEALSTMDEDPDREIDRAVEPIRPVVWTKLDGTPLTTDFYYYRSTLDPTLQQAYDLLRAGILEGKQSIDMKVPVDKAMIFDLYKMVIFDSPDLFWAETNGMRYYYNNKNIVTSVQPGYNDLAADIPGNTAKLEAAVAEALADMWSLPTQVEKAKYAHDYLTHHINYTYDAKYNQTAYSAIVNGQSVCAGYAHAFQYMMQQMGIPCAYVLGYVQGYFHAWNLVQLDGEYYAMDVTWDDPLGATPDAYYYDYFNLTEQAMSVDHVRAVVSEPLPAAEGTLCSYQNAFGGNAKGTDFAAIVGVMPEKNQGGGEAAENPYLG